MNATDLLRQQHREVEKLLAELEEQGGVERERLRRELAMALVGHDVIEKEIFYPAMLEAADDDTSLFEAFEEHAIMEFGLKKFLGAPSRDPRFDAKLKVLSELVLHHVQEEEQELLRQADKEMEPERLAELGRRMQARFEQIRASGAFEKLLDEALGLGGRRAARTTARKARKATTARKPAKRAAARRGTAKKAPRATTAKKTARRAPKKRASTSPRRGAAGRTAKRRTGRKAAARTR